MLRRSIYYLVLAPGSVNIQGGRISEYELYRRKRNAELQASKKPPLTKKQQKARDKSKRASKARNKLRQHPNYKMQLKNERISRSIK